MSSYSFEQAVIELFQNIGYTRIYTLEIGRTNYSGTISNIKGIIQKREIELFFLSDILSSQMILHILQ